MQGDKESGEINCIHVKRAIYENKQIIVDIYDMAGVKADRYRANFRGKSN